jgi:uncharacterized protein DUF4019
MSMRQSIAMAAAVLLTALAVVSQVQAQSVTPEQRQALDAAERWLAPLDAQRYADAWAMAAESFKASVGRQEFRDGIRNIRKDYGKVIARKAEKMGFVGEAPNPNDAATGPKQGTQVAILFETKFAGKKQATEELSMVLEKDGLWRVAGYYIR